MKKTTLFKVSHGLLAAFMLGACATNTSLISDYAPKNSFKEYATFSWADKTPTSVSLSHPVSARAKRSMDNALRTVFEDKGYYFVDQNVAADFLVSYEMNAVDKLEIVKNYKYYEWLWLDGGGTYSRPNIFTKAPSKHTVEGSIDVDVIDGRTNDLIWNVSAKKELSEIELKVGDRDIEGTARKLLRNIPIR